VTWLLDPRLAECRRIFLREVLLDANIGIHDFERAGSQRLVINRRRVRAAGDEHAAARPHQRGARLRLRRLTIRRRIEQGHINLQETLIDDIARALLAHPSVAAVRVASEKPDVYEDVEAVGIEVFRFKDGAA